MSIRRSTSTDINLEQYCRTRWNVFLTMRPTFPPHIVTVADTPTQRLKGHARRAQSHIPTLYRLYANVTNFSSLLLTVGVFLPHRCVYRQCSLLHRLPPPRGHAHAVLPPRDPYFLRRHSARHDISTQYQIYCVRPCPIGQVSPGLPLSYQQVPRRPTKGALYLNLPTSKCPCAILR